MDVNPVARKEEYLAMLQRQIDNVADGREDAWEENLTEERVERERYILELEWIIYTSVRLTDIMLEGHSEATYKRITEKFERLATE